ncbi:hypothetical protein LJR230_000048 [Trinickia sp. LjRoot230]|uniref:hypothetical protein n=1 Tax=Trinickia sp. LjRoot230 TaxID=3342288 RepID=UPI003ECF472B
MQNALAGVSSIGAGQRLSARFSAVTAGRGDTGSVDRRTVLTGAGVLAGAYVIHEVAQWLRPPPLQVPRDVPASSRALQSSRMQLMQAARHEADELIESLKRAASWGQRDASAVERAKDAIKAAKSKGGWALIEALDRYWQSPLAQSIHALSAKSARSHRCVAQINYLRLHPTGESDARTRARHDALAAIVKKLRAWDWTCKSRPDGTIACSL